MPARSVMAPLGEFLGTFLMVFLGVGVVQAAVLTGAQSGLGQVAAVWGGAVALAIYCVGAYSGAHLNPAMTVAFAVLRRFPLRRVGPYVLAQCLGAFCAAALLYGLFHGFLERFETAHGIVRGAAGSEASAMVFGEYFPHPGVRQSLGVADSVVTLAQAMLAEAVGTALLAFAVFALTDRRNAAGRPGGTEAAVAIGAVVALVISVVAPLTQAGLNPARDFGPRLFAWLAGWNAVAIPGPRGGFFTVYILAPIAGALAGGGVYGMLARRAAWAAPEPEPSASGDSLAEEEMA